MRNASRRKALYQWCPTCSHIKLHTIQQAIIFVCFLCSQVSAHSSGTVHCVNSARSPSGDSSHFQNRKCKDMEGKYLHAFEHLSILDSDDEGWDTMKKEYKNAADQHDDELEA